MTVLSESNDGRLELEEESKNIALAIFRFGARRGIGVYYSLLVIVPVFVAVLDTFSVPSYFTLVSVGLLIFGILFLARFAGMKRFYQMRLVMGLFEEEQKKEKRRQRLNRLLEVSITPLAPLLPLIAAAIFEMTGSAIL